MDSYRAIRSEGVTSRMFFRFGRLAEESSELKRRRRERSRRVSGYSRSFFGGEGFSGSDYYRLETGPKGIPKRGSRGLRGRAPVI